MKSFGYPQETEVGVTVLASLKFNISVAYIVYYNITLTVLVTNTYYYYPINYYYTFIVNLWYG